ncbi:hypothetical protein EMIT0P43_140052 [Pseudomonas jessenii]
MRGRNRNTRGDIPDGVNSGVPAIDMSIQAIWHTTKQNVGAGLLAKAVFQATLSRLALRLREQARSHRVMRFT